MAVGSHICDLIRLAEGVLLPSHRGLVGPRHRGPGCHDVSALLVVQRAAESAHVGNSAQRNGSWEKGGKITPEEEKRDPAPQ